MSSGTTSFAPPPVIRHQISKVKFGMFTDADTRSLSAVECVSPLAFDSLGNPLPGGVYDERMGPTDLKSGVCVTCGQQFMNCPGHMGHIEVRLEKHTNYGLCWGH